VHKLVYEYFSLLTIIELVESFSINLDDIRDGNACNFMKYFAEAPNTGNGTRFSIKTSNAKHSIFAYMGKFYLFNENINSFFYVGGKYIFHRHLSYSDLSGMYILQMI